ncbi:hypothetical protein BCR42DRAFT_418380 [Absidia repens]|uniref:Uncharacterized protein n=1 Tax=Absidia repens TaxID=90262 RepID=A0A1X2ICZ1_9FUNG|nr:hypothetical protein BCR42DRAFT_418380 [Absidia repens]
MRFAFLTEFKQICVKHQYNRIARFFCEVSKKLAVMVVRGNLGWISFKNFNL